MLIYSEARQFLSTKLPQKRRVCLVYSAVCGMVQGWVRVCGWGSPLLSEEVSQGCVVALPPLSEEVVRPWCADIVEICV